MYRQNIETLENLAQYLEERIAVLRHTLEGEVQRDQPSSLTLTKVRQAELMGEIDGFSKVLQILYTQFKVKI